MKNKIVIAAIFSASCALILLSCGTDSGWKYTNITPPDKWNPNEHRKPAYIHITYQQDPATSATIQWQTEDVDEAAYIPKVWLIKESELTKNGIPFDEKTGELPFDEKLTSFGGYSESYCRELYCGEDTVLQGRQWAVSLTGLEPDTVYYYRVGTWASFDKATKSLVSADLSPIFHFKTGLPKGTKTKFQFGFGSDSQSWYDDVQDNLKIITSTTGKDNRFWLFGGDLTELNTQTVMWQWFDIFSPLLNYYAAMPVLGNHDIFTGVYLGEFALPVMPELPKEYKEAAWSFDFANLHVIGFYGYSEAAVQEQLPFIEADLSKAAADPAIDWIVSIDHQSAYSSSSHGCIDYIQNLVSPLFDKYHVDMAFSGHDHDYERSKPMNGGQIVEQGKGTVYVVAGGFYSQKYYGNGTSDFTAISIDGAIKNYVIVTIEGNKFILTVYSGAHEKIDSLELTKPPRL